MTENEQIEEMARDIDSGDDCIEPCKECAYYRYPNCRDVKIAKRLYAKGYRKVERGEWIAKPQEFYIDTTDWMCSVCKEEFSPIDMVQDEFFGMMKFCPHCGADMRGEKDA